MKYKDLIQFESVDEIIKFDKLNDGDYRDRLVKTFVCSNAFENFIIPRICRELDLDSTQETRGIQVVGNYGTGKSHLMSLFSIIAEDAHYLDFLNNQKAKECLQKIAGRYKVVRFEISGTNSLWDMITYQIDKYLEEWCIDYSIYEDNRPVPYYDKLEKMLAAFEDAYPDKGFMFVIDEMLSYLQGHAQPHLLGSDLQVLQALGHMSDRTKFRMVFGVQELIYQAPEFQFAADMLSHVADRYTDLKIEKSDVQFIVQERLLRKNAHQQQAIKDHLQKFITLFPDLSHDLDTFVNLYPVHPSYFDNFQQIRVGKNQREVLKVLSRRFETMLDKDVPENEPGLICYDSYWEDMQRTQDLMAIPDVRKVSEITSLVDQKIDDYFTGGRSPKKPLAHRIVAASAIKILQSDLTKTNGVLAESLANDLCFVDPIATNFDELVDLSITTTLNNIVKATIGQYFERNEENLEYHLRIEGGVNYKQNVINYAATMPENVKDEYFYDFLAEIMPVDWNVYRPNFRIWDHSVNWKSHNVRLDGYIFMGNPNAKSTTQPKQHFYLYFMPIFDKESAKHQPEEDGIFFLFDTLSQDFRDAVTLYGASQALINGASSVEKPNYKVVKDEYFKSAREKFNNEFLQSCMVEFNSEKHPLSSLNPQGEDKMSMLSNVASDILENLFSEQCKHYPKFSNLPYPLGNKNRENVLKAARIAIATPQSASSLGTAILNGLGLWTDGHLSTDHSQYAQSLKNKLEQRGGQVLNCSDILKQFYEERYVTIDFEIEADLEFVVMAAMAQLGEIEIVMGDSTHINAGNIEKIVNLNSHDFNTFSHIAPPKGINIPLVRELSLGLLGSDRTAEIDIPDSPFFADLLTVAQQLATKAVTISHQLRDGFMLAGVEVLSPFDGTVLCNRLDALKALCDKVRNYNTKAKLRNLQWTKEQIHEKLVTDKGDLLKWEKLLDEVEKFKFIISYLSEAKRYVADSALKSDMEAAINRLSDVIVKGDAQRKQYMQELEQLKERYADYYLAAYVAAHLPATEEAQLTAIKNMPERQVAETVAKAVQADASLSIISLYEYDSWTKKFNGVRIASPTVTKQTIMQTPFQNFNPVSEGGKPQPNLKELKQEIAVIHAGMEEQIKAALEDPMAQQNKQMLSQQEATLFDEFVSGNVSLSAQYVHPLLTVLKKLSTNFNVVELTMDSFKSRFNRPLDIESARNALSALIDDIINEQRQQGKKYEDIRIIIK